MKEEITCFQYNVLGHLEGSLHRFRLRLKTVGLQSDQNLGTLRGVGIAEGKNH